VDPSRLGVRPNLFIVGAGKAGTYTLYAHLRKHPDVFMSAKKEPNFFGSDLQFRPTRIREDQYLALFGDAGDKRYRGEASVSYLLSRTAASEIRAYSPDAKIIIVVRNPIEVLQARHTQNLITGAENIRRLDRALAAEAHRRLGKRVPMETPVIDWLYYREWVKFSEQIRRYQQCFPKEQIFIGVYDDLKRDSTSFYRAVLEFLDLPIVSPRQLAQVNPRLRIRSYLLHRLLKNRTPALARLSRILIPSHFVRGAIHSALLKANVSPDTQKEQRGISPALRHRLQGELTGEVQALGELLDRDLSHWLKATTPDSPQRPDPD